MKRRSFLAGAAATAGTLAAPARLRAAGSTTLKFIPQSDVTILDPVWTTAYVTRNHSFLIFDTLYGTDGNYAAQPQMVAGHTVENDGLLWKLTLRDGLKWHDGEKVLARDCVASIARWGARDAFGQTLISYVNEMTAPDDKTIQIRLKKPFALLPDALGKPGSNCCAMMPERLATTDAFKPLTEMVGSGPFKWVADERVVGSFAAYAKNDAYVPRDGGAVGWTAGPKIAHFDRIEWHVVPDESTKAAAIARGEVDWWENPTPDILALLRKSKDLTVRVTDATGNMMCMRFEEMVPPFNAAAIRRALFPAIDQTDYMTAIAGDETSLYTTPVGYFCPGMPTASDAGMQALSTPRNTDAARRALDAAGYQGQKIALMVPTDQSVLKVLSDVAADMFKKIGIPVDYQAMDWGTLVQRRAKMDPVEQGGWNAFITGWAGLDQSNPVGHAFLRGNGKGTVPGWPDAPKIEALRQQWIDAPNAAQQKDLARQIQLQAFEDVPYIPLGQYLAPTVYNSKKLSGILDGFAIFWNVKPA